MSRKPVRKKLSKRKRKKKARRRKIRRRKGYPTDLTKAQWKRLKKLIPQYKGGRPRKYDLKEILNAIFYIVKTGCQWRMLPDGFPHWKTVYTYFRNWRLCGLWEKVNDHLRKKVRERIGKNSQPSAAIIDSQSVKTTSVGGDERGFDGGKKVNGRKRHILVDTLGLILIAVVHSAGIQDREGGLLLFDRIIGKFSRLKLIWADCGYRGDFITSAKGIFNRVIEVITRDGEGFKVVRKRWIVERTFGWLVNYRRHRACQKIS